MDAAGKAWRAHLKLKTMEWLLIGLARALLPLVRALPLRTVARIGRLGGAFAWHIDRRHRGVALQNLERGLPELPLSERRAIARENFRRIGENYLCGVRAAGMPWSEIQPHLDLSGLQTLRELLDAHPHGSVVAAAGHFGNFELLTWVKAVSRHHAVATTYRALRQAIATRMLQRLREQSGCLFFERRRDGATLRKLLRSRPLFVGLLVDQHERRGIRAPFLGHDAWTSTAPAVLALRYGCPLITVFCYRTALAQWRLEYGEEIATRSTSGPRAVAEIVRDMNASLEAAVRRDPANWFWVHRRWKA